MVLIFAALKSHSGARVSRIAWAITEHTSLLRSKLLGAFYTRHQASLGFLDQWLLNDVILLSKDTGSILANVGVLCRWCPLVRMAVITCISTRCPDLTSHAHISVVARSVRVVAELLVHNFSRLINMFDSRLSLRALLSAITPLLHRVGIQSLKCAWIILVLLSLIEFIEIVLEGT